MLSPRIIRPLAYADDWLLSVAFKRMRSITARKRMKHWNVSRLVNVWYSTRMVNLETIVPKGGAPASGFYLEETHDDTFYCAFVKSIFIPLRVFCFGGLFLRKITSPRPIGKWLGSPIHELENWQQEQITGLMVRDDTSSPPVAHFSYFMGKDLLSHRGKQIVLPPPQKTVQALITRRNKVSQMIRMLIIFKLQQKKKLHVSLLLLLYGFCNKVTWPDICSKMNRSTPPDKFRMR